MKPVVILPVSVTVAILAALAIATGMVWADPANPPATACPGLNNLPLLSNTTTGHVTLSMNDPFQVALASGVYETRPYACMIKVPEPTGDDCVGGIGGNVQSPILIIHPEIHLVPQTIGFNLTNPKPQAAK